MLRLENADVSGVREDRTLVDEEFRPCVGVKDE